MTFLGMQRDMHCNSLVPGYYYPTRDVNLEANGSFWTVRDVDKILVNGQNLNNALSFPYPDLYLRHYKDALKQTMLEHESIFEDQIRELHRLYWRQQELMVEMKGTTLYNHSIYSSPWFSQDSSNHLPRTCHTTSFPWMNTGISDSKTCILPQNEASVKKTEFFMSEGKKLGKKVVLDLELPAYEYIDAEEDRHLGEENVHKVPEMSKESSPGSTAHNLSQSCSSLKTKILDLNEPIKAEETSDSVFNNVVDAIPGFQVPSSGIVEESEIKHETEASKSGLHEVIMVSSCKDDEAGNGIDLTSSPQYSCEEKPSISRKIEFKQPQESISDSSHGKRELERFSAVVQALPRFNGLASSNKCSKSSHIISRSNKSKCSLKIDAANFAQSGVGNRSKLGLNSCINKDVDDDSTLKRCFDLEIDLEAPLSPENTESARPSVGSDSYQTSSGKKKLNSSPDIESDRMETSLENKECFVASVEDEQERIAAEAIVNISSSCAQTDQENSLPITSYGNLHWFAKIASSVVDDTKSRFGLSFKEFELLDKMDYFEVMTLQLTEMKVEEQNSCTKTKEAESEVAISNFVTIRPRMGRSRRGRRQHRDFQSKVLPSLASLSRNEVTEDLQMIEGLMEARGAKWEDGSTRNKGKNGTLPRGRRSCVSSPKVIETRVSSSAHIEERRAIDWGTVTRGRRGLRSPAVNFRLILGQQQ